MGVTAYSIKEMLDNITDSNQCYYHMLQFSFILYILQLPAIYSKYFMV